MKDLARWVVAAVGLALLAIGVWQVGDASSEGGAVALVIAGAVLLVSPFIVDRLEHLSVSNTGLELRLSHSIAELGAPGAAEILEQSGIAGFAESYALVHEELRDAPYEAARIHLQDVLVERTAAIARRQKFKPSEVRTLFRDGSPMIRVLTLGLMHGDPSLADGATIISAITDSRSGNEQYHGLKLAEICWRQLTEAERTAIKAVLAHPYIQQDSDRRQIADRLVALPGS
jgi:hypothetical protein